MGRVVPRDVEEALEHQRSSRNPRLLGEILVEKGLVGSEAVKRALVVRGRFRRGEERNTGEM